MKKTLLTFIGTVLAVSAMAQGTINFGNPTAGAFRNPIYDFDCVGGGGLSGQSSLGVPSGSTVYNTPLLQGTNFVMALYAGPAGISDPNLFDVCHEEYLPNCYCQRSSRRVDQFNL